MSPPIVWTETFRVRAYEVGPGDLASPLAVIDYLQEAAGEHARALGVETFQIGDDGGVWVLARLAAEVERLPAWRESVTVETWPSGRDGLRATRDLLLKDADSTVLVRARTVWFVVDLARRQPVRLPPAVVAIDPPDRPGALRLGAPPEGPGTAIEAGGLARSFGVRRSDLDRNEHANNARFAEWALEAADRDPSRLAAIDLVFKGEAVLGDTVTSEVRDAGGVALSHAILHQADSRLLATARTLWR